MMPNKAQEYLDILAGMPTPVVLRALASEVTYLSAMVLAAKGDGRLTDGIRGTAAGLLLLRAKDAKERIGAKTEPKQGA